MNKLERASILDVEGIARLYQSVKGTLFCTWNEYYPTEEEIRFDLQSGGLYVLREKGELIGAISVLSENEYDDLCSWTYSKAKELARVVIHPDNQGRGLALSMLLETEEMLKNENCQAIHLMAAVKNLPACRTYRKAGYQEKGKVFLYGNEYFGMEKKL